MKRMLIAALAVVLLAGCGGGTEEKSVRAKVNDDGSYTVGTTGDQQAQAAVKAAVKALPAALSYDYRKLDEGVDKAAKLMTSDFADEYTKTFDATTRPTALEKQAITSALVRGAGVVGDIGDDKATVLVYLDQVLMASKDKKSSDPLKISQNRVRVKLVLSKGHWLVDGIEPF